MHERNAVITSFDISFEDGRFLTSYLHLDYGGAGQGFGGYCLGGPPDSRAGDHKNSPNVAAEWLVGIFRVVGVERLKDIPGKVIRVRHDADHLLGSKIVAIGHAIQDIWFNPKEAFEALKKEQP